MTLIRRVEDKRITGAVCMLTTVALLAGFGHAAFDYLITVTLRAPHGHEYHDRLLVKKAISW
jgi:hypothetical protein